MGALVRRLEFPMITLENMRKVDPKKTFTKFSEIFPGEALTLKLRALKDDEEWKTWNDTRNVLSHRVVPGHQFFLSNVESGQAGALWLNGITIGNQTTSSRRESLVRHLSKILESAHIFARDHF